MADITTEVRQDEPQYSLVKDAFDRLIANKLAIVGLVIVAALFFIAIAGPFITPYDFLSQDLQARNQAPSAHHWFGTDDLGRDVLSRVIYGARTAVIVAFSVTFLSLLIGMVVGSLGGYLGGKVDAAVVWFIDIIMSVPSSALGDRGQCFAETAPGQLDGRAVSGYSSRLLPQYHLG